MYMEFKNEFLISIFLLQARENEKCLIRFICLYHAKEAYITIQFVFSSNNVLFTQWASSGCFFLNMLCFGWDLALYILIIVPSRDW